MSYETKTHIILQKTLKKRITGVLRKLLWDSRQLMRDLSAVRPKIVFRLPRGIGFMLLSMDIARCTLWKPTSRNRSLKWHVIWTSKNEILTEQFIGNRWVRSYDVRSWKMEEIPSLISIGSSIFGREAVKPYFNTARTPAIIHCIFVRFKDTLEEKWSRLNWWVMWLFQLNGKNSYFNEDTRSIRILDVGLIAVGRKAKKDDKLCSSLH